MSSSRSGSKASRRWLRISACSAAIIVLFAAPAPAYDGPDEPVTLWVGKPAAASACWATYTPTRTGLGVLPGEDAAGFLRETARLLLTELASRDIPYQIEPFSDPRLAPFADRVTGVRDGRARVAVRSSEFRCTAAAGKRGDISLRLEDPLVIVAELSTDGDLHSLVGSSRRPGIVLPADVVATVLTRLGEVYGGLPGEGLTPSRYLDLEVLEARLQRDARVGSGPALAVLVVAVAMLALGAVGRAAGAGGVPHAGVLAAVGAPLGYVAGMFVPSGSWAVRSIPLVAAVLAAVFVAPKTVRAVTGTVAAGAIGICGLAIAAAARPYGEPALSLWGNPLESWRLFGLRNHLVAFVAGGLILWIGLARPRPRTAVATAVAATVVVGAPWLGANFGGVLWLVFGAILVVLVSRRRAVRARDLIVAGATAIVAMGIALLADTGSPVSHGGRAVRTVTRDGLGALIDILRNRARLNWREVTDLSVVGYVGAVVVIAALVALTVWGARNASTPHGAVAFAGAAAGLLALVTEDSGFFTGGILGLYPAAAWLLAGAPVRPATGPAEAAAA